MVFFTQGYSAETKEKLRSYDGDILGHSMGCYFIVFVQWFSLFGFYPIQKRFWPFFLFPLPFHSFESRGGKKKKSFE